MVEIPDITNLGLIDEEIEVDIDNMPEESGGFDPIIQPGTYDWELPEALLAHVKDGAGTPDAVVKAIAAAGTDPATFQVVLRDSWKLKNLTTGTVHRMMFSNRLRKLGEGMVSDIALILRAVRAKPTVSTNTGYLNAFLWACGESKRFTADATLSCSCNDKNDIYTADGRKEGVKGCGRRYDQDGYTIKGGKNKGVVVHKIKRVDGKIPDQFECDGCPAILRPWMNLRKFKPIG